MKERERVQLKTHITKFFINNSKYWKKGSLDWAKSNNKNVLVQRALKVLRVLPEGKITELIENEDYELINYG